MTCPSCGQENPAGFRLCGMCGTPLGDAPAVRQERKVVTVLFADLVGFTSKAEAMDPEDVRALLGPYWQRLRGELERFGGTVEKFIGDAVVAIFGAPVAHEDDPERAVRAALAIRDWIEQESDLHVRIGVNTGEALVSLGVRPAEGEGMASGDVVNTAARLQSAAPVDGILVGEQTHRATERTIEYREHAPIEAKGKAEPVRVWEVAAARARFGVDLTVSARTPFVGREGEVELLRTAFERAVDERIPQLLTVVGVPGIGKSRLLGELFAAVDSGDRLVRWRQGRSLPYGEGVSFWALGEMVKAEAGVLETDSADETRRKLGAAVAALPIAENERGWLESHLAPLVGLTADSSGPDRAAAFAAWRRFLEALADDRPLVLVFEDLHWADDGLLDFVDALVDWLTDVPVLVVGTARPELLARRPAWSGGKPNASTLSLAPLDDDETAQLVHALLERSVLPAETQAALLERAGGNPLYAEEFVRMVAEHGSDRFELPGSVQGIVAARLDALDPEDKALLQDAAVVGKVFWTGALAAIGERDRFAVDERMRGLERRELVRRARHSSVEAESEYAFRHVLIRDVAYGTIPRAERVERHRRAAEWIEALGRPDDQADLLAHHYLAALELARDAGVDAGLLAGAAATALLRAGERAAALNDFASAARFFSEALELGVDADARPRALLRLGAALHRTGDDRRSEQLEAAREALLGAGDPEGAAEAGALLAEVWWDRGQTDRGRAELARAQEILQGRPPGAALARVLLETSRYAMLADETAEAIATGREALRIAEELGLEHLVPDALINIGTARAREGDRAGGAADLERAVEIARETNNPALGRAYNNLAAQFEHVERAYELHVQALEASKRLGNAPVARFVEGQLLLSEFDLGRWDEFLPKAEAFIAACEAGSPHYAESYVRECRAKLLLARHGPERAAADAARALELARRAKDPQTLQPALGVQVSVDLAAGRHEEARRGARELLDLLGRTHTPFGLMTLAIHRDSLGLTEEVEALVRRLSGGTWIDPPEAIVAGDLVGAAELMCRDAWRVDEAQLRVEAGRAFLRDGRRAEAEEQLERALAFYRSVGATRLIREVEALVGDAHPADETHTADAGA